MNSSSLLSGHPPTSLPTSRDTRSSPGRSRLARMCSMMNPESSPSAAMVSSGGRSGDSIAASDQPRKSSRSDSSIPRSSAITVSGNGAASSATKSISSRASTASSNLAALLRIDSARPAIARGVNRRLTSPRKAACSGGSMWRIERDCIGSAARAHRVIDQGAPSGAEVARVAAQIPYVLVAGDRPEARRALVHGFLGAQPRQHVVVVVPDEEGGVPRVDPGARGDQATRIDLAPLVPGHHRERTVSAVRTHDDIVSHGAPRLPGPSDLVAFPGVKAIDGS